VQRGRVCRITRRTARIRKLSISPPLPTRIRECRRLGPRQAREVYGTSNRLRSTEGVFLLTLITNRADFYSRHLSNRRAFALKRASLTYAQPRSPVSPLALLHHVSASSLKVLVAAT